MRNNIIIGGIFALVFQCFVTMHGAEIFEQFVWSVATLTMVDVDMIKKRSLFRIFFNLVFVTTFLITFENVVVTPQIGDKNLHHMLIMTFFIGILLYIKFALNSITLTTLDQLKRGRK